MDRHGYFGGLRTAETRRATPCQAGQKFRRAARPSKLRRRTPVRARNFNNPLFDITYDDGQPSTITEVNWPPPNRFRAGLSRACRRLRCVAGQ
jgi:hypothetical protein